jgi:glyoxylase I family protein
VSRLAYAVEHLGLAATDPRRLADWYLRVLDATERWHNGAQPPAVFVTLPGGPVLEIYPAASTSNRTGDNAVAGWRHVALRVADLAAARALLAARGVPFTEPEKPAGGGGRVLFFADPEGNLLHLVERPADSPLA